MGHYSSRSSRFRVSNLLSLFSRSPLSLSSKVKSVLLLVLSWFLHFVSPFFEERRDVSMISDTNPCTRSFRVKCSDELFLGFPNSVDGKYRHKHRLLRHVLFDQFE